MIEIKINTGNDAFGPNPAPEIARILHGLAEKIGRMDLTPSDDPASQQAVIFAKLRDINGNAVGDAVYMTGDYESRPDQGTGH